MKLDVDGKRVSIPESMCQKVLDKLLVVNNAPMDIYIAPRDPMHKGPILNPKPFANQTKTNPLPVQH